MAGMRKLYLFAIVMAIVAMIVHTVESLLTMGYYTDPANFLLWSKLMMPGAGPPPAIFYAYSLLFAFVSWMLFGFVYIVLSGAIKEKDIVKRGLKFGMLIFLVGSLPGALTMVLLLNLPLGLIISWVISGLALNLAGGVAAAGLIKE